MNSNIYNGSQYQRNTYVGQIEELIDAVDMIPFALLSGTVYFHENQNAEVRITKLAENGFVFRTAERLPKIERIELCFYKEETDSYEKVMVDSFPDMRVEENDYYFSYQIFTKQQTYVEQTRRLIGQYYHYVTLKLEGDDAGLSQNYTGYPAELDEVITTDFKRQQAMWYEKVRRQSKLCIKEPMNSEIELAIELDHTSCYQRYLSEPIKQFASEYWAEHGFAEHFLSKMPVQRIYIGNQFCHNLFPKSELLFQILGKAKEEKLQVTLATTYLREEFVEQTKELIQEVYAWCVKNAFSIELVINDWGMSSLLEGKQEYLIPVLGVLLNKRRKDPRMMYKRGFEKEKNVLADNALNQEFYQKHLEKGYEISRYEYEACGYPMHIAAGKHSLHLPYYQTNTSQYCPLYARCHEGSRGVQKLVKKCPEYCNKYVFSYPDHLHMVGRYNSLFGYDSEILGEKSLLPLYVEQGIDRIVVNLM